MKMSFRIHDYIQVGQITITGPNQLKSYECFDRYVCRVDLNVRTPSGTQSRA